MGSIPPAGRNDAADHPGKVVSKKVEQLKDDYYIFWCPGCEGYHGYRTDPGMWKFNGDLERPTFTPSLLNYANEASPRCHLFVTDGMIRYCSDSDHALAGKTVEMIGRHE